mmetsp:Transcript_113252/g.327158  ORF Transcript_113252/g.327158 Transcript_113252/m.327158 type:complete len:225 (+) Transcript_113252:1157-1831(+)
MQVPDEARVMVVGPLLQLVGGVATQCGDGRGAVLGGHEARFLAVAELLPPPHFSGGRGRRLGRDVQVNQGVAEHSCDEFALDTAGTTRDSAARRRVARRVHDHAVMPTCSEANAPPKSALIRRHAAVDRDKADEATQGSPQARSTRRQSGARHSWPGVDAAGAVGSLPYHTPRGEQIEDEVFARGRRLIIRVIIAGRVGGWRRRARASGMQQQVPLPVARVVLV